MAPSSAATWLRLFISRASASGVQSEVGPAAASGACATNHSVGQQRIESGYRVLLNTPSWLFWTGIIHQESIQLLVSD